MISPFQAVAAAIVNAAFPSRTSNSSISAKYTFTNIEDASGVTKGAIWVKGGVTIDKKLKVGGDIEATGNVSAANISGSNSGDVGFNNVGSTPSPKGATMSGQQITLQPADDTNPGLMSILAQMFAGVKTFKDKVIFLGGVEAYGDAVKVFTTELEVKDAFMTLNKGGTNSTAEGAGVEIERVSGGNGVFVFDSTVGSKWKAGIVGAAYEIIVAAGTQVIGGLKTFSSKLTTTDILIDGIFYSGIQTNTQTGANVTLTNPTKPVVAVTAALTSISKITAPSANCQTFILVNRTGGNLTIKNADTTTDEILTGTGLDLVLGNGKTLLFVYDTTTSGRWRIVGGTGSGGNITTYGTMASPRLLAIATGITSGAGHMDTAANEQVIFIKNTNNFFEAVTANPQIEAGTVLGQKLRLVCASATAIFSLTNGNGLSLNGDWYPTLNCSIDFFWNGTVWSEFARSDR